MESLRNQMKQVPSLIAVHKTSPILSIGLKLAKEIRSHHTDGSLFVLSTMFGFSIASA